MGDSSPQTRERTTAIKIAAILVNYHTTELLPPVINQLAAAEEVAEIIVVHNGGSDPLEDGFETDKVRQISLTENLGFSGGVNAGLAQSACDWALLINPDVRLDPGCIAALAQAAQDTGATVLGPRFYWDDARQWRLPPASGFSAGDTAASMVGGQHPLDAALLEQNWAMRHDRFWSATTPFAEPFLSGACLLVRRDAFEPNLLDERYFLYYEDTDLCARAVLAGEPPICVPAAGAVHYWNRSPAPARTKLDYMAASKDAYIALYYGNVQWPRIENARDLAAPPVLADATGLPEGAPRTGWLEMSPHPSMVPFAQARIEDHLLGLPGALWQRLDAGWYYFRIRDDHGRIILRWRCKRPQEGGAASSSGGKTD